MESLPSSFDLFFDIKTKEQLIQFYGRLCENKTLIEELCATHKIDIKKEGIKE